MILEQATTADADARTALIEEHPGRRGQGPVDGARTCRAPRWRSSGTDVTGTEDTLDASFKFRYGALAKG